MGSVGGAAGGGVRVGVLFVGLYLGELALEHINFSLEVSLEEVWGGGVHVGGQGFVIQWLLSSLLVLWALSKLLFTSGGSLLNVFHLFLHLLHLSGLFGDGNNLIGL